MAATAHASQKLMGEQFGGYTLREKLAVGGMAELFLARHVGVEGFEKDIVIKRIRPHLSQVPAFVSMFLHEAKLAAALSHPNIVQIYDLGKIDESYFIAMEYVAGRDLAAILPKARSLGIAFPVEYALKIGQGACEALGYAHQKTDVYDVPLSIVHRDVTPDNIRVAWTGQVKLLDFGIAKAATQLHETKGGEVKGKVAYMSPEQVLGKELDHRCDIFSLGVVLYECLCGVKLFAADNEMASMRNILEGRIYPPSYYRDDCPEEVEAIIMRALARDRDKRYQSALDMQYDIEAFFAGHEFAPSNLHLSNFVKQLFKSDREAEMARRRLDSPVPSAFSMPAKSVPEDVTVAQPSPFAHNQDTQAGWLTLRLNASDTAKLERLAQSRASSPADVAREMIENVLRYVT